MTMTSSGPVCDVCNKHILLDKSINPFTVKGIAGTLICHDDCKPYVEKACLTKDFHDFPPGPLREVFEQAEKKSNRQG